jgi:hypothetical protein
MAVHAIYKPRSACIQEEFTYSNLVPNLTMVYSFILILAAVCTVTTHGFVVEEAVLREIKAAYVAGSICPLN